MSALVQAEYNGMQVVFTDDAWFNATEVADRYGKKPAEWLRHGETERYLAALCRKHNVEPTHFMVTKRGKSGGTWFHPKLAVAFARWLDVDFSVWCDEQIDGLIRGKQDWKRVRHEATSSFKVMTQVLKMYREDQGKESAPHHFSNEARLVNWALTGEFGKVDRESLDGAQLDLLARLEERNTVLIARGVAYDARKAVLEQFAIDWRFAHAPAITSSTGASA